jgi:cysteinyl-tRNA synthetase
MHNGFVQVDDEKMSKSLGNFFTVREVLQRYAPEVVRLFILTSHYRGPLNYSDENLEHAKASLTRLYTALRGLPIVEAPIDEDWRARFEQAMDDDFNTPEALAALFDLAREVNRLRVENETAAVRLGVSLRQLGGLLGLLQADPERFLQGSEDGGEAASALTAERVEVLIAERAAARKAKNWVEADRIRILLQESGIVLEDTPKGTLWRRD